MPVYGVFLRLRPENFPHIRLAQLAYLYQKVDKLFSQMMEQKPCRKCVNYCLLTLLLIGIIIIYSAGFFAEREIDGREVTGLDCD